jgi:putative peptidoglycan lipid II flippase
MQKKFTSTVAGASILIALVGIISKGLGFLREVIFANSFGLGADFDIYLVSSVIPVTLTTIIFYIAQNYYIPLFAEAKKNYTTPNFFNRNLIFFFSGSIILSILLYFFSDYLVTIYLKSNVSNVKNTAKTIFQLSLICIPFTALNSFFISYLQSELEYRIPAYSQIVQSISILTVLILLNKILGIIAIPVSFIAGTVLQFIFLAGLNISIINFKYLHNTKIFNRNVITKSLLYVTLIEVIGQFYILADRFFFDKVDSGGIAALNYGVNVFQIPILIFTFALSTALFPKFSNSVAAKDWDAIRRNVKSIININFFIYVPIVFIMFFYGDIVIKIIYQRGKFTSIDTLMTFEILKYMSLALVFYAIYGVLNKLFYSFNLTKVLFLITLAGIFIKILLNFILVTNFRQTGLAVSTVITYLFFFLITFIVFAKKISFRIDRTYPGIFLFYFLNGLVSYFVSVILPVKGILSILTFLTVFYTNLYYLDDNTFYIFWDIKEKLLQR